jgi:hypothetical protein
MISGAAAVANKKRICPGPKQLGPRNLLRARHSRCAGMLPMSGATGSVTGSFIGDTVLTVAVFTILLSPVIIVGTIGYVGYRLAKRDKS